MPRYLLGVLACVAITLSAVSAAARQSNDGGWVDPGDGEGQQLQQRDAWTGDVAEDRRPYRLDGWDWAGQGFGTDLYMVQCVPVTRGTNPCPGDGILLVRDVLDFPGAVLKPIGGPYTERWQVEDDRARLARLYGLPSHSLRVMIYDADRRKIGQFWLGARPDCADPPTSERGLTGDVNAEFGPSVNRPPSVPLGYTIHDYSRDIERLRPICEERRANMRRLAEAREGFGGPPAGAAGPPPGQPPSEISHLVVQTIETVYEECWKAAGAAYEAPATCRDATIWTFVLNNGTAHADRRQYDSVRAQFTASGMTFAYATIKSEKRY